MAKENSQQNTLRLSLPQPQLSTTDTHHLSLPQPQDTHHLSLPQPQLSSTDTEAPAPVSVQQVTASSQRVQQAYPGPLSPPDHLSRERSASQPPQNQETGSFFSNQLCEGMYYIHVLSVSYISPFYTHFLCWFECSVMFYVDHYTHYKCSSFLQMNLTQLWHVLIVDLTFNAQTFNLRSSLHVLCIHM